MDEAKNLNWVTFSTPLQTSTEELLIYAIYEIQTKLLGKDFNWDFIFIFKR